MARRNLQNQIFETLCYNAEKASVGNNSRGKTSLSSYAVDIPTLITLHESYWGVRVPHSRMSCMVQSMRERGLVGNYNSMSKINITHEGARMWSLIVQNRKGSDSEKQIRG